jgi:dTDP-4-amino-4,6-dideoxy-D-galactose acyltransferase
MDYQILEWDTAFFGIRISKITSSNLEVVDLRNILAELKLNSIKLAYWASSIEITNKEVEKLGGQLVDRKTTFNIDFESLNYIDFISHDIVEPYDISMPLGDLEALAVQNGEYSRFLVDTHFPKEKSIKLYKIWITRSLNKEIAEEVLVVREGKDVVGMITLGEKNGKADIGLLAVEKSCRRKKFGEMLVRAAQRWFINNGYKIGQVVTQGKNIIACNLYKKCGYSIKKVEYFYHFWL